MRKSKKTEQLTKSDHSRKFDIILIGAFAVFIVLFTTFRISGDDDLFWHLATGKYIAENKMVPGADVFGFSTLGKEWIPFEWGWDVLNYSVYSFGGYTSISILRTAFFLLMFYFLLKISGKLKINPVISVMVFLLLLFGILERLLIKPQISSYLFFGIIIYIFLHHRVSDKVTKKIYWLPLVFFLWANMHMGVLAGIGVFAIFLFSEFLVFLKPSFFPETCSPEIRKRKLIILSVVFAVSLFALLLNPHGIRTFTYVYSHLQMKMIEEVFEWRPPLDSLFDGTIFRYVYYAFLGGALIILLYSVRRKDLFAGLLTAIFTLLSFRSSRFSIDFMIISSVFLVIAINYFLSSVRNKKLNEIITVSPAIKIVLILLITAASVSLPSGVLYKLMNYDRSFGFGIDTEDFPVNAVKFLKENNIVGQGSKPFNTYYCGGYLIWEISGAYNFIDSRNLNDEIYYSYKSMNYMQASFEQKFDNYGFDYVLWFYPKLPLSTIELKASIASYLIRKNDKWRLVFWDDNSMVFIKNNARNQELIRQNEYKYVNPYYFIYEKEPLQKATYDDPGRIVEEIQRNYKLNPNGVFITAIVNAFRVPAGK